MIKKAPSLFLCFVVFLCYAFELQAQPENKINENGYNEFFYKNGNKSSEGKMVNGKPDGYWKTYYESGKLKSEGNREEFQITGIWKFYSEEGVLTSEINYLLGQKDSITKTYNKEGFLVLTENFLAGVKTGWEFRYVNEGSIVKSKIEFVDGREHGNGFIFDAIDGHLITILQYVKGFQKSNLQVNRYSTHNLKQGLWREYHSDAYQQIKIEGRYTNGKKDGYFREYSRKGILLSTTKYKEGLVEKNAEELDALEFQQEFYDNAAVKSIASYNKQGELHGVKRSYSLEGEITGTQIYQKNILLGEGILNEKGIKQEKWQEYYENGNIRAEGTYVNGEKIGIWTFYHENGKIEQKGKFLLHETPTGEWNWYYDNGQLERKENFRGGLEDGFMTEYASDGTELTKGEYIDGLKEGPWYYAIGDHIEEGEYIAGSRNGNWIYKYTNGEKSFEGNYLDGTPEGKHTYYHDNGRKKLVGKYEFGFKQGDWERYNRAGEVMITILYKDGIEQKINGVKIRPILDNEYVPEN